MGDLKIMGDAGYDFQQLSRESFRLDTYDAPDADALSTMKHQLARAGFYYTRNDLNVKCFVCDYEFDVGGVDPTSDFGRLHKEKRPECRFAMRLVIEPGMNARSKKFLSYDSLRYEKERLETFIEWPIPWLSPDDLAADGFYYLRTNDHSACVYCRGIVGAWEVGDTPRGEHQRHFPHCPFIRGQPVGNVPLNHSSILDKLPLDGEECPLPPPRSDYTIDQTEAGATGGRYTLGSYAEGRGPARRNANVNYEEIGLAKYTGPKRKDYITKESRVKSFARWPERVVQKPDQMADAGFFYCGLSDHVRCFHCGNGLRNWEIEDHPWEEHARWYPKCNFVILSKGQEFIDKVRRERPPYLRSAAAKDSKPRMVAASSGHFKSIAESDLEPLMDSDIIQAMKGMGFPLANIRKALRQKLEQTGMPFFSLEPCIEAVIQFMEEETRHTIQNTSNNVEDEAITRQNDKMRLLNIKDQSTGISVAGPPNGGAVMTQSVAPAAAQQSAAATITTLTASSPTASSIRITSSASASSTVLGVAANSAVTVTATRQVPTQPDTQAEAMEVEYGSESMETEALESPARTADSAASPTNLPGSVMTMQEADERMSAACELLKPGPSGPPSLEAKGDDEKPREDTLEGQTTNDIKKVSVTAEQSSQKEISEELERIRESRTCRICMDAEMDVVFLPCTHMATCSSCAVTMAQCPICRNYIKYTIKPIFS